ncbi:Alanine aminotransferase 1 [Hondaea fermentalgiana]|uniref:Alanine aminotransferase 1 n=1 Tax=Hondaea fermentalgiana TaxID=2315210 RepID=A0A2R5GMR3_9STRA|nr:Alanine aminotransferase 1 [Hondaea fermentalgiana]|eukprot:GBG31915.1 Alanine aminotransferase 1 [Hondaea fermentalgiana]
MVAMRMMVAAAVGVAATLVPETLAQVSKAEACETEVDASKVQLREGTMNSKVLRAEYAVRGPLLLRALEIEDDLRSGTGDYPFSRIVKCNIGNPQSLGQKPISFTRQVLSLVMNPELMKDRSTTSYPSDTYERAEQYLDAIGSIGAYSESQGVRLVREEIAAFISERDGGVRAHSQDLFLTAGASEAVKTLLTLLIRDENDAVLIPIPQYPLYSSLTALMGGYMAEYYMGEEDNWAFDIEEVRRAIRAAKDLGKTVRAIVVINPGNPTGSKLTEEDMREIVSFCLEENLILMADEVYQKNIYRDDDTFTSFRSIVQKMGLLSEEGIMQASFQLASFHSTSKGVVGECGLRGGYVEMLGFPRAVIDQFYKLSSIGLCSNVPGQIAVGLMVNPPREGSPSFAQYEEESMAVFGSLKRRAAKLEAALNAMPGVSCKPLEGAMYAFPKIELPESFVAACLDRGQSPDVAYALELLESTGLVVVPGSGFGQREGTYHVRTTFLPPEDVMEDVLERFKAFHLSFMEKHAQAAQETQ